MNEQDEQDQPPPYASARETTAPNRPSGSSLRNAPRWLTLAIGSGAFAALNGVFAKLVGVQRTTASHTHSLAVSIAHMFGAVESRFFEVVLRAGCFGLNLVSNAIMWVLFTAALTAATSTTRVAILNTSSNFMVTAVMGMMIFGEHLPSLWWAGAALLVAGSVVIGAREGKAQESEGQIALAGSETEGEAVAVALGGGGLVENTIAEGRFRDAVDDGIDQDGIGDHVNAKR